MKNDTRYTNLIPCDKYKEGAEFKWDYKARWFKPVNLMDQYHNFTFTDMRKEYYVKAKNKNFNTFKNVNKVFRWKGNKKVWPFDNFIYSERSLPEPYFDKLGDWTILAKSSVNLNEPPYNVYRFQHAISYLRVRQHVGEQQKFMFQVEPVMFFVVDWLFKTIFQAFNDKNENGKNNARHVLAQKNSVDWKWSKENCEKFRSWSHGVLWKEVDQLRRELLIICFCRNIWQGYSFPDFEVIHASVAKYSVKGRIATLIQLPLSKGGQQFNSFPTDVISKGLPALLIGKQKVYGLYVQGMVATKIKEEKLNRIKLNALVAKVRSIKEQVDQDNQEEWNYWLHLEQEIERYPPSKYLEAVDFYFGETGQAYTPDIDFAAESEKWVRVGFKGKVTCLLGHGGAFCQVNPALAENTPYLLKKKQYWAQ